MMVLPPACRGLDWAADDWRDGAFYYHVLRTTFNLSQHIHKLKFSFLQYCMCCVFCLKPSKYSLKAGIIIQTKQDSFVVSAGVK